MRRRFTTVAAAPTVLIEPGACPPLQGIDGRAEGHSLVGEQVLHARRVPVDDLTLDDPLALELLQALGEQSVGKVGDALLDLGEARGALEQDEEDRAGPALADELDGLVVLGAAHLAGGRKGGCRVYL